MTNSQFKIKSKGQGILLYRTKEKLDKLISWNDYEIVYMKEK
ncbi:MAG: hypothetical protein OEL52_00325 [Nitrosopumilus sp.]|nr:hypothetical protein [Nitrosopumilus sp.]